MVSHGYLPSKATQVYVRIHVAVQVRVRSETVDPLPRPFPQPTSSHWVWVGEARLLVVGPDTQLSSAGEKYRLGSIARDVGVLLGVSVEVD